MTVYYYNGTEGQDNFSVPWEVGTNDKAVVRLFGMKDIFSGGRGSMDVDLGDGDDVMRTSSDRGGVAHGGSGNDQLAALNTQDPSVVFDLYGGTGNDHFITFSAKNVNCYGGDDNDAFVPGSMGGGVLDGGSGFDYVSGLFSGLSNNAVLSGYALTSVEGQIGSNQDDLLTPWGTDVTLGWTNILMGSGGRDIVQGSGSSDLLIGHGFYGSLEQLANFGYFIITNSNDDNASDTLHGGSGDDTLVGSGGQDELNGDGGLDTASYIDQTSAVSANLATGINSHNDVYESIEGLIGTNSSAGDDLIGDGVNNVLDGLGGNDRLDGAGGNDTLYGRAGNDLLIDHEGSNWLHGGAGDDRYVATGRASVVENAGEGTDTLAYNGSVLRLADNVENVELLGLDTVALTGLGNGLDNLITGHGGANRLDGRAGRDTLDGGTGNDILTDSLGGDTLRGGAGDDTYVILATATAPLVEEGAGAGLDTVQSNGSYTLTASVENLILSGALGWSGTGNGLGNTLTGNGAANALSGLDGADRLFGSGGDDILDGGAGLDRLDGGAGNDILRGGTGGDTFVFAGAWGSDTIEGWQDTVGRERGWDQLDRIDLRALAGANDVDALNDLLIEQAGTSVTISLDLDHDGAADARDLDGNGTADAVGITVLNATAADFGIHDFVL